VDICVHENAGALFGEVTLMSRDTDAGRIVIEYPWIDTPPVAGLTTCGHCEDGVACDWCQCAE
jgi:hypothetical protein